MSYSRRELYALGETLGDSVTVKKLGGGYICGGGGGGSVISDIGSGIGNIASDVGQGVTDLASQAGDAVSQGFSDVGLGGSVQPIVTPVVDTALAATGNPEFIPAFNAANTFAQTGNPISSALSGATAYAGSAFGGLFGDATSNLTDMIGQDALSMQAQGLGAEQIAQNLQQSYGIDQYAAQNAAGIATGGGTAANIASALASDYGTNLTGGALGAPQTGSGLSDLLGYAKTGSQIAGGLAGLAKMAGGGARVAGGVQAQQTGKQISALAPQAAPFQPYQSQLSAQLFKLLSDPGTVTSTPGYQFNLQQGLQAQQAQQAAQGRLVSGGALLQANQFGQQYAQSSLNQQESMLASLTGATQSPAAAATAQGNLLAGGLGGQLGGSQAIAGGLGTIASPLSSLYSLYNQASPDQQVA
jgi:hypothetical protein